MIFFCIRITMFSITEGDLSLGFLIYTFDIHHIKIKYDFNRIYGAKLKLLKFIF